MHVLAILALLAPVATGPASDKATLAAKPVCQTMSRVPVQDKRPLRAHPLTAEPNAKQVLTVLRTVDGCTRPVVVREDIGARP
jgi:hypothetical protein